MKILENKKEVFVWIFLFLFLFFRCFLPRPVYRKGQRVKISAKVTDEPVVYDTAQGVKIAGLFVYLPKYPQINYNDFVVVEGTVEQNNGRWKLEGAKLINLRKNEGVLIKLRQRIIGFYEESLPAPHSSLLAGMTIGSKSLISGAFWEVLKKSGTAHVVVASGMNVTLVAGFVMGFLLIFFSRKISAVVSIVVIWMYAVCAGFDAPIVRAAVMGSMLLASQIFGKAATGMRILIISAVLMLLVKPDWIRDLGFWMSFAATLSLMLFSKSFDRLLRKIPGVLREGLSTSLAAQIGVAPILYYTFGYINIASPIANALVLWTVPYITIMGMIAAFSGLLFEPLGKAVIYLTYPLTSWFVFVAGLFA
jgi:ComEC/Rec2-related protein